MSPLWMEETIHDKGIKEKIKERRAGKTDVQLGKKGITEGFIREVKNRLEKNGVVKIRILKSFIKSSGMGRREIADKIAKITDAKLIEVRGYTFILALKNREKNHIMDRKQWLKENRMGGRKWLQR